jgi:protein TonB
MTGAAVDSGWVPGDGEIIISAQILTRLRSGPPPRYPESLRAAGVDGRVIVQFVVDTLGIIEPASVKIILSSHDFFTRSVEAVLPRYRFVPSEVNGRRVRALAQMPFEFHLTK